MKLISLAQLQQKKGKVLISFEQLSSAYEDIIVISGGSRSNIFNLFKQKKIKELKDELIQFRDVFKDDFCIEVQKTGRGHEDEFIKNILPLAYEFSIPVIATNDVMFSRREDFEIHETKVCINTGKTLNDSNREKNYTTE
jgi:DNA polymerase-3 subunit alpha